MLCMIHADISELAKSLRPQTSASAQSYYSIGVEVIILFGQTELRAQICWMDKVRATFSSIHFPTDRTRCKRVLKCGKQQVYD